ncbi:MAG: phytanoyl-CoA dioxygenase family protein [Verrucomicrobia bacterium]|nr:phytanoyl-CoA dioxygenase family protein [Verrucomicrobiota bacterium]MDA1086857.1 phytanoyl-CoA dioxygenase family protein [Verrucomicrobiota bacterium]
MKLSDEQLAAYERDGYVAVEELLDEQAVMALRERLREYTHGGRPTGELSVQIEPRVERGELQVEHPGDGVRKIDCLVQYDDLYRKLGTHPNILGVIEQILGPDIKLFRNAMLLKPPDVGSAKGMHQDSPYWPIRPMELCSCWFAIDDATTENGCMGVIPGGHGKGELPHVHVTDDFVVQEDCYDTDEMVLAPLRAGGGLFFHSLLPHYTAPNRSQNWRRAIALSYMSAKSTYTGDNEKPDYLTIQGQSFPGCV